MDPAFSTARAPSGEEVHLWRFGERLRACLRPIWRLSLRGGNCPRGSVSAARSPPPLCGGAGRSSVPSCRLPLDGSAAGDVFLWTAKPSVRHSPSDIRFNLSHSNELMVIAVCRRGLVGVDIEKMTPDFPAREIAARYFCERERMRLIESMTKQAFGHSFSLDSKRSSDEGDRLGIVLELSKVRIGLNPLRVQTLDAPPGLPCEDWCLLPFCPDDNYRGTLALTAEPLIWNVKSLPVMMPLRWPNLTGELPARFSNPPAGQIQVRTPPGRIVAGKQF